MRYDADVAVRWLYRVEQVQAKRVSAWVVGRPTAEDLRVTRIIVAHPKDGMGPLRVFVVAEGYALQMGVARGCGYDKLQAALEGLTVEGVTLAGDTHWSRQLRDAGVCVWRVL